MTASGERKAKSESAVADEIRKSGRGGGGYEMGGHTGLSLRGGGLPDSSEMGIKSPRGPFLRQGRQECPRH